MGATVDKELVETISNCNFSLILTYDKTKIPGEDLTREQKLLSFHYNHAAPTCIY